MRAVRSLINWLRRQSVRLPLFLLIMTIIIPVDIKIRLAIPFGNAAKHSDFIAKLDYLDGIWLYKVVIFSSPPHKEMLLAAHNRDHPLNSEIEMAAVKRRMRSNDSRIGNDIKIGETIFLFGIKNPGSNYRLYVCRWRIARISQTTQNRIPINGRSAPGEIMPYLGFFIETNGRSVILKVRSAISAA